MLASGRAPVALASLALLLFAADTGRTATILINNGLAPPNPANVIDDSAFADDSVRVRNVGCDFPVALCTEPAAATSVAVVSGGVAGELVVRDTSSATISGGIVNAALSALESADITLSSGSLLGSLFLYDSSRAAISDGSVGGGVGVLDSSHLTLSGGSVGGAMLVEDSSIAEMAAGAVGGGVFVNELAHFTLRGGAITGLLGGSHSSRITISGGTVAGELIAFDSTVIVLFGSDFAVDGVPVPFGDLTAVQGTLTGTLQSGDLLENPFFRAGSIRLVPEPGTALLLGSGLLGLAGHRRARASGIWSA